VKAVCMILESWAVVASRPEQTIPDCPPSQSPNRIEVVAIAGEVKGISAQQILTITRNADGGFVGFTTLSESDGMQGRFAEILPPKKPDETQAQMAKFALAGMGYVIEGKGTDPIWN
jgi:hypothetical protein